MKVLILKSKTEEDKEKVKRVFEKSVAYDIFKIDDIDVKLECLYSNKGNLKGFDVYRVGSKSKVFQFNFNTGILTRYSRGKEIKLSVF